MFTLAHLSDPHLAPLPTPHWKELIGKRATGYINWQKKRRFIHDAGTLAAIVADIKAQEPDHIAVTGDIVNIALAAELMESARMYAWIAFVVLTAVMLNLLAGGLETRVSRGGDGAWR